MTSEATRSEHALARLACEALGGRPRPRLLLGGLGMGFTLREALDQLPPDARVVVVDLNPVVVDWCRGPLAALTGDALADRRVTVRVDDVARVIAGSRPGRVGRHRAGSVRGAAPGHQPSGRSSVWNAGAGGHPANAAAGGRSGGLVRGARSRLRASPGKRRVPDAAAPHGSRRPDARGLPGPARAGPAVSAAPELIRASYVDLDVRLGWRPDPRWEVAIVGQNLLREWRKEYEATLLTVDAIQVRRAVYGSVTLRY